MRLFKWTLAFRCYEESSIVLVWISLPYLPIHYLSSKDALFAIASTIGKPLRVNHATATVTKPTMARILVEYDIAMPLILEIWIGEEDLSFWQDVMFENVPTYYSACKHLGHADGDCYIANPHMRKPPRQKEKVKPQ